MNAVLHRALTGPSNSWMTMAPDSEPFEGLPLDEPLVDEEAWERAGRALVSTPAEPDDD